MLFNSMKNFKILIEVLHFDLRFLKFAEKISKELIFFRIFVTK